MRKCNENQVYFLLRKYYAYDSRESHIFAAESQTDCFENNLFYLLSDYRMTQIRL